MGETSKCKEDREDDREDKILPVYQRISRLLHGRLESPDTKDQGAAGPAILHEYEELLINEDGEGRFQRVHCTLM